MRTTIIVEQGETQIALTPENDWERRVLEQVVGPATPNALYGLASEAAPRRVFEVRKGAVWDCRGGYTRISDGHNDGVILRLLGEDRSHE